jgi:hypothetical protein
MQCTQVVAGVWHGLFPGYALFFVTSAFMFESAKVIYRYEQVRPRAGWLLLVALSHNLTHKPGRRELAPCLAARLQQSSALADVTGMHAGTVLSIAVKRKNGFDLPMASAMLKWCFVKHASKHASMHACMHCVMTEGNLMRTGAVAALELPAHLPALALCQVGLHRLCARLQRGRLPGACV